MLRNVKIQKLFFHLYFSSNPFVFLKKDAIISMLGIKLPIFFPTIFEVFIPLP